MSCSTISSPAALRSGVDARSTTAPCGQSSRSQQHHRTLFDVCFTPAAAAIVWPTERRRSKPRMGKNHKHVWRATRLQRLRDVAEARRHAAATVGLARRRQHRDAHRTQRASCTLEVRARLRGHLQVYRMSTNNYGVNHSTGMGRNDQKQDATSARASLSPAASPRSRVAAACDSSAPKL